MKKILLLFVCLGSSCIHVDAAKRITTDGEIRALAKSDGIKSFWGTSAFGHLIDKSQLNKTERKLYSILGSLDETNAALDEMYLPLKDLRGSRHLPFSEAWVLIDKDRKENLIALFRRVIELEETLKNFYEKQKSSPDLSHFASDQMFNYDRIRRSVMYVVDCNVSDLYRRALSLVEWHISNGRFSHPVAVSHAETLRARIADEPMAADKSWWSCTIF